MHADVTTPFGGANQLETTTDTAVDQRFVSVPRHAGNTHSAAGWTGIGSVTTHRDKHSFTITNASA